MRDGGCHDHEASGIDDAVRSIRPHGGSSTSPCSGASWEGQQVDGHGAPASLRPDEHGGPAGSTCGLDGTEVYCAPKSNDAGASCAGTNDEIELCERK